MKGGSSAGPFTTPTEIVAASNLSIGSGFIVSFSWWAHLTTSALFRARAPGPVSGQLSTTIGWRGRTSCRGFLLPFSGRHWLLGHPVPAKELGSPHGRLTGQGRTQTGFSCFARTSNDRGGRPLYPEHNGAHPDRSRSPASVCRISALVPTPRSSISSTRESASRSINQGFKRFGRGYFRTGCQASLR